MLNIRVEHRRDPELLDPTSGSAGTSKKHDSLVCRSAAASWELRRDLEMTSNSRSSTASILSTTELQKGRFLVDEDDDRGAEEKALFSLGRWGSKVSLRMGRRRSGDDDDAIAQPKRKEPTLMCPPSLSKSA